MRTQKQIRLDLDYVESNMEVFSNSRLARVVRYQLLQELIAVQIATYYKEGESK